MKRFMVLLGVVCLLLGWIAGRAVQAQETAEGPEWRTWRTNTSGRVGVYNVQTGKVYVIEGSCGSEAPEGCLVALPVVTANPDYEYLPSPY